MPSSKKSEFITWGEIEDAFSRFRDIYIKSNYEVTLEADRTDQKITAEFQSRLSKTDIFKGKNEL